MPDMTRCIFRSSAATGSSLIWPRAAPIEEALDASRFGAPHLVGNAARVLADRWPADAPPPFKVDALPAPDIAWVGWLGAAVSPSAAPARRFICARPTPSPPRTCCTRRRNPHRHDGMALRILGRRRRGGGAGKPARCAGAGARFMARRFTADGAKANSRTC